MNEIDEINQGWLKEDDIIIEKYKVRDKEVICKKVIRIFKNNKNKLAFNLKELRKIDFKDHETPNWKFRCYAHRMKGEQKWRLEHPGEFKNVDSNNISKELGLNNKYRWLWGFRN